MTPFGLIIVRTGDETQQRPRIYPTYSECLGSFVMLSTQEASDKKSD